MAYGDEVRARKRMGGRFTDIAFSFIIITVPMVLFAALLLGLVFHFRVTHNDSPNKHLQLPGTTDEPRVYYVNLSATVLVFIASWSSSLAPMLVSFVLALAAYPICRQYLNQARASSRRELLTPYQLALTLRFMNGGGFGAVWSWLKYHAGWKHVRQSQGSALSRTALVAILTSLLALAVFAADTWLHVTTKTVEFIQLLPVASPAPYSFALNSNCTSSNNSLWAQYYSPAKPHPSCSIAIGGSAAYFINSTQSLQVLNNVSEVTTVLTYESNPPFTYLGIPQNQVRNLDYTATTFGMTTQCNPVSRQCNLRQKGASTTLWNCSDTWSGDLGGTGPNWNAAYFTDSDMTSSSTSYGVPNPYYWGYAAIDGTGIQSISGSAGLVGSLPPDILGLTHGGIAFVLACTITHYEIEYDSVNGTITRFVSTLSNDTVANVWQVPPTITGYHAAPKLLEATDTGIFSSTAQELADTIALAYSQAALALGAQSVIRTPSLAVQERKSFLVSRVPAAPLFTLVAANLLFGILGVILALIAIASSGGDVREVQARLSIVGLVADRFEGQRGRDGVKEMDDYFEEKEGHDSMRVGIDRDDGAGFAYKVWQKTA